MVNRPLLLALICFAGMASLSSRASAQRSTVDCAKVQGTVEQLVCKDQALAALDRKLDSVYTVALTKTSGKRAADLRTEQRGWTKGRNDCWKATVETRITMSWTVNTVRECTAAQYRLRTSELQSVWRLVTPRTVRYACQNKPAQEIVANFFATDPATIRLERGDRTVTMWRVGAPSAGTYEGQNVSLLQSGNDLKVSWLNINTSATEQLQCKAR